MAPAALQVYWGANVASMDSCPMARRDQARYCRTRPTYFNKREKEKPKTFKLQFMVSAEVQTAPAKWNGENVGA
eukprot:5083047-Pyramimonas_sp.AAC.1